MKSHARMVGLAMLLNLAFWAWFWGDLWRHTREYTDRTPKFEETLPVYKFGGQALPLEAERSSMSFSAMLLVQRPAFFMVGQIANAMTSGSWEQRIGGLSIGAFVLIGTTLLSFVQWAAVVLLLAWAVSFGDRLGFRLMLTL
ncbi:MAG: hypothetical protein KJZ70_07320 [Bryobacterales bacterium]|nr:hypothetical protein [Bryobacterales bacterium]